MTSSVDHMHMANAVYGNVKPPPGWRVYMEWPLNHGYRGVAYVNDASREVVIAHQGSDSPLSDPGDWIKNNLPHALNTKMTTFQEYMVKNYSPNPAKWLYNTVTGKANQVADWSDQLTESGEFSRTVTEIARQKGFTVSHTGHSLGGFLASVNGARTGDLVEAFDPPASRDYLEFMFKNGELTRQQIDQAHGNTISHLSKGSFIDLRYGPEDYHGTVHQFDLGEQEGFDLYQRHKMDNIINGYQPVSTALDKAPTSVTPGSVQASPFKRLGSALDQLESAIGRLEANVRV